MKQSRPIKGCRQPRNAITIVIIVNSRAGIEGLIGPDGQGSTASARAILRTWLSFGMQPRLLVLSSTTLKM